MNLQFKYRLLAAILIFGMLMIMISPPARAAGPWYVAPAGNDGNSCLSAGSPCASINGAIEKASSGDTIYIATGTYTSSMPVEVVYITKSITLSGGWNVAFTTQSGMSTIDGGGVSHGIVTAPAVNVVVERFVIQKGLMGASVWGGGIYNLGTLRLNDSAVINNTGAFNGSGIYNFEDATLILNNCTIRGNTSQNFGGAIINYGSLIINNSAVTGNTSHAVGGGIANLGALTINNSTISENASDHYGGGIFNNSPDNLSLNNTTVSGNTSGILGGGIFIEYLGQTPLLQNSILAGNMDNGGSPDCHGPINSSGYNLIGNTAGCGFIASNGDLTNISPLLGPLRGNDGPTLNHALLPGSPAIDAGNPAGCVGSDGLLTTDQRGITRPQGNACDIGAFEYEQTGVHLIIDIAPKNSNNIIDITSSGTVPVAVLSTISFDAPAQVVASSLTFGRTGEEASPYRIPRTNKLSCSAMDVDGDGLKDLICMFEISKTGFQCGDRLGIVHARLINGELMEGTNSVRFVPCD